MNMTELTRQTDAVIRLPKSSLDVRGFETSLGEYGDLNYQVFLILIKILDKKNPLLYYIFPMLYKGCYYTNLRCSISV